MVTRIRNVMQFVYLEICSNSWNHYLTDNILIEKILSFKCAVSLLTIVQNRDSLQNGTIFIKNAINGLIYYSEKKQASGLMQQIGDTVSTGMKKFYIPAAFLCFTNTSYRYGIIHVKHFR